MSKKKYNLTGMMLVASPTIKPASYFAKSVIYVVKHNLQGVIGLIVNQKISSMYQDLYIKTSMGYSDHIVNMVGLDSYIGGPVDPEKGFLLHMKKSKSGIESIKMNSDIILLKNILNGKGPKYSIFIIGYCGWDSEQLSNEIRSNAWIVIEADRKIIFETSNDQKWTSALSKLDINPALYMNKIGRC